LFKASYYSSLDADSATVPLRAAAPDAVDGTLAEPKLMFLLVPVLEVSGIDGVLLLGRLGTGRPVCVFRLCATFESMLRRRSYELA